MATLAQLRKRADDHGYAVRKLDGLYAVVDIETGGPTHANDALNSPYTLTLDEVAAELDRLT